MLGVGGLGRSSSKPIKLGSSLGKSNGALDVDGFFSSIFSSGYFFNLAAESMEMEVQLCGDTKNLYELLKRRT